VLALESKTMIAVKVTDILGEEVLIKALVE